MFGSVSLFLVANRCENRSNTHRVEQEEMLKSFKSNAEMQVVSPTA